MNDILNTIILLYSGVLFLNSILASYLWFNYKDKLYRYNFFMWLATFLNFLMQGIFTENHLMMTLSYGSYFFASLFLALILGEATKQKLPIRRYSYYMGAALPLTVGAHFFKAGFILTSLPMAIGISIPMLHSSISAIFSKHTKKYNRKEVVIFSFFLILNSIHFLDYPFLRLIPSTAVFGYSFALFLLMAFSIFIPSFIIKTISAKYNEEIRKENEVRKETEAQLKNAIVLANVASVAKSNFLGNMSHELRTPLNGIMMGTDILSDTSIDDEQRECLDIVVRSGERLLAVVNNILDFSRLINGNFDLQEYEFEFSDIITETKKKYSEELKKKNLLFKIEMSGDIPKCLLGDYPKIKQVVSILLSNALKFTHEGTITLSVSRLSKKSNPNSCAILFEIKDTGIGIPKESIKTIFDSFNQVDNSITRRFEGSGLGLSIAKEMVKLLKGEIGIESEVGSGTVSWFTTHLKVNLDKVQSEPVLTRNVDWSQLSILYVEDEIINQMAVRKILERRGVNVTVAENGKEGLECYQSKDYDMILMDIQMPIMDGLEAIKIIRSREISKHTSNRTPIIAVTARALIGDREVVMNAGADGYISKPVNASTLYSYIEDFL